MDEFYDAIRRLPEFLRRQLEGVPKESAQGIQEIRLRSERPVMLTVQNEQKSLQQLISPAACCSKISHTQLRECFLSLCDHSLHSYESQLAQGFFTLPGGHRVGVAGILQTKQGELKGLQCITSLNIRVARMVSVKLPNSLEEYLSSENFRGLMLIGAPGSGKTTLLRAISAALSEKGKKVAVVDERMEIWPCSPFGFAGKMPVNCDVLSGFQKEEGILQALRSLGPEIILCDELGTEQEMQAVNQAARAGVNLVCTVHGKDTQAPRQRFPQNAALIPQCFSCLAVLGSAKRPGEIGEVHWI